MKEKEGPRRGRHARHAAAVEEGIGLGRRCVAAGGEVLHTLTLADERKSACVSSLEPSKRRSAGSPPTPDMRGRSSVERVKQMKGDEGFNAQTETYENLVQAGVIDPTRRSSGAPCRMPRRSRRCC